MTASTIPATTSAMAMPSSAPERTAAWTFIATPGSPEALRKAADQRPVSGVQVSSCVPGPVACATQKSCSAGGAATAVVPATCR